jgi:hypothetical protein
MRSIRTHLPIVVAAALAAAATLLTVTAPVRADVLPPDACQMQGPQTVGQACMTAGPQSDEPGICTKVLPALSRRRHHFL